MFPKEDSEFLYPTRIPFEESTVYSEVNIKIPNLNKFPKYQVIFKENVVLLRASVCPYSNRASIRARNATEPFGNSSVERQG